MVDRQSIAVSLAMLLALSTGCGNSDSQRTRTPTPTSAATAPVTPTATASTGIGSPTRVSPPTSTGTPSPTVPTPTATSCSCNLPTSTATLAVPTPTATPAVPTPSATSAVPTATPAQPEITYFGIARADDAVLTPALYDDAGRPIFIPVHGQGVTIVLEARHAMRPLERTAYDPSGGPRGVDFLVSHALGNGSPVVCDDMPPLIGGVPGIDPPLFSDDPTVVDAIDDLGCRVNDGTGAPDGRSSENACTRSEPSDQYAFIDPASDLQYCLPIAAAWSFAVGDTIVAARVRDVAGVVSAASEIVVRVEPEQPFTCDVGLGERDFTVRRPPSRLLTSATGTADASTDLWAVGTLRLCAGTDIGEGLHPLTLREDAVLGLPLADGGTLCAKISARGSNGFVDCNGGTAADVRASQDLRLPTRVTVDTGLGLDAGTGAATILAPIAVLHLPPGSTPAACQDAAYPSAFSGALTTAMGSAQVIGLDGDLLTEIDDGGTSFDCAAWQSGGSGTLVLPFPLPSVSPDAADLAAMLELSE